MGPNETVNDDEAAAARPAGQVTVRCEPAANAGAAAEGADARKGADELLAPALEEAGYGYGV